jgi:hypothetical protein
MVHRQDGLGSCDCFGTPQRVGGRVWQAERSGAPAMLDVKPHGSKPILV